MQANTDAQARRRKDAFKSAISSTLTQIFFGGVLLWFRSGMEPERLLAKAALVIALLDLGMIVPIWISLKNRLKEIQGGEEDAAAQY